jgi:N utilization substance protein A
VPTFLFSTSAQLNNRKERTNMNQNNQFGSAIDQICEEPGLSKEVVIEAIEAALAAAYKKDFGDKDQEVRVVFDPNTAESRIFVSKEAVETVEHPDIQISLEEAKKLKDDG